MDVQYEGAEHMRKCDVDVQYKGVEHMRKCDVDVQYEGAEVLSNNIYIIHLCTSYSEFSVIHQILVYKK